MNTIENTSNIHGVINDGNLFIASSHCSLDDFLKTDIAIGKHIYCSFSIRSMDPLLWLLLNKKHVLSISFNDGFTLYPVNDEKPDNERYRAI